MNEAILLTGGGGSIGSHVAERLLALNRHIVIIDDLNDFYDPVVEQRKLELIRQHGDYPFYQLDIRN